MAPPSGNLTSGKCASARQMKGNNPDEGKELENLGVVSQESNQTKPHIITEEVSFLIFQFCISVSLVVWFGWVDWLVGGVLHPKLKLVLIFNSAHS